MAPGQYGAPFLGTEAYASWLQRVGSTLIDSLVTALPGWVIILIGIGIGGGFGVFVSLLGYLAILGLFIWNIVIRQGTTGQSVGKQALHVKLVRERDGQVIGPGMSFVRYLAHIIDAIPCYLGYLWPLWDARRQTFADKVCATVVIRL
jgi:uncharacterized RDD family membrane protein YckC